MATTNAVMTVAQIRAAEERTMHAVAEDALMDRAAAAVAAEVRLLVAGSDGPRVAVLAGSGNNGGDALLAGALLAREGAEVTAVALGSSVHLRGRTLLEAAGGRIVPLGIEADAAVAGADAVVDGIVGIGSRPGLRDDAAALVARIVAPVVAVDLPSGLDADSAAADLAHVRADVTVTFTAPKRCLVDVPARAAAGRVVLADVGIELG
ncbi:NAD(P)H-hydrate epimerase [Demequina lignilytica]|uniref:NAD(P)H-hydrate epimerase n=1 Tax=Demequina lignilytica TaxID=3051663 RepID=A0AB35MF02_9MICO|nr:MULTISPECIES: NAD(P)H-hydrate epimerase [unclassified Demequina]MDN4482327.1 NAD(P)H-hydrate epimerase [Demequina sp. SYSU T0a273]MDN4489662.1 NAD(P)H-hydrate epimerase [Demequina sp. SYSU T00068]